MIIDFHKRFDKSFKKLPEKTKEQFYERLKLFRINQFEPILNNHALRHPFEGCRSINISGDLRALYEKNGDLYTFVRIGTHSELFK